MRGMDGEYWVPEHVRAYLRGVGVPAAVGGHGAAPSIREASREQPDASLIAIALHMHSVYSNGDCVVRPS